jgi:hypothetical protein
MLLKPILLQSLLIASSILGIASQASAENLAFINTDDGTVYQIDLDERTKGVTPEGLKYVEFYLSTATDAEKHRSLASCAPYDLKSEDYNFDWLPNNEEQPEETVPGKIARLVCGD